MKIICVGGTSSNSGKTSVVCMLLKALPGWAVIKVTPCRAEEACPRGHDCSACRAPETRYEIVKDINILSLEGKDTARYTSYGAEKVMWIRALPEFLNEGLESAINRCSTLPGVIIESTTAFQFLKGLHIMVTQPESTSMKESARLSMQYIDVVAVNRAPSELDESAQTLLFPGITTIAVCAMLPNEHPHNQRFIEYCLDHIDASDRSNGHAA